MLITNKSGGIYEENKFTVFLIIIALCITGCNYKDSFQEYSIGEIVGSNRDSYIIKLNKNYIVECFYNGRNIIYQIDVSLYPDIESGSKMCYEGKVRICYCSDDYLILCLFDNNKYVIVDCKNNGKVSYVESISDYDLSDFIKVDIWEWFLPQ